MRGSNPLKVSGATDCILAGALKASIEMFDGLTMVYRFEHKINAALANLADGGHLSCVGLSGGFGSTTLDQVCSASYNSFGASPTTILRLVIWKQPTAIADGLDISDYETVESTLEDRLLMHLS